MQKTKVLIVDDYEENCIALAQLISDPRVEVHTAKNAVSALELIAEHDFGLALLDVQMPDMSGFELAQLIRSVKRYRNMPIIFVTAHSEDSSVIFKGYQSGAIDVLFKPLDPDVVRAKTGMFVELAQQKKLLEQQVNELTVLRQEAESANLAKSQFLANMSHEIRTPLAAVIGFSDLIVQGNLRAKEAEEYGLAVQRNGHLLLHLIDDILDLSKIEANKLEVESKPFSLGQLIRDIEMTMIFRANEKGVSLNFYSSIMPQQSYSSDALKIKQVLLNIIGNAIKFSPGGKVRVEITTSAAITENVQSPEFDSIKVQVKDNGVGFSVEQAKRIFQPFVQADASTNRKFGGSGLGLVISREIARLLGGDITLVHSTIGQGSEFEIVFKLKRTEQNFIEADPTSVFPPEEKPTVIIPGAKILAVDDSEDNLTLVSLFLRATIPEIVYASSGSEALSLLAANDFDLILMDIQMPGMDGHETTKKFRARGFDKPIIALTAHGSQSERQRCLASGCNLVLTKPVTRKMLVEVVLENLGSRDK